MNIKLWLIRFRKLILVYPRLCFIKFPGERYLFQKSISTFSPIRKSEIGFSISIPKYNLSKRTIFIDEGYTKCKEQLRGIYTSFPPTYLISQSEGRTCRALMNLNLGNLLISHGTEKCYLTERGAHFLLMYECKK